MYIADSVARIKTAIEWFPGGMLGVGRQTGKTQALLETIHDKHFGRALLFCVNSQMAEIAMERYVKLYPIGGQLKAITDIEEARGLDGPIYVDEWWFLDRDKKRELISHGRIGFRIGTPFE